jgi:hypothetical protein
MADSEAFTSLFSECIMNIGKRNRSNTPSPLRILALMNKVGQGMRQKNLQEIVARIKMCMNHKIRRQLCSKGQ